MKTKIVMIAPLVVSLAMLVAMIAFGVSKFKSKRQTSEWDLYDEKEGAEANEA